MDMNKSENNYRDLSTCGALHSIGSDLTRTRGKSDAYQNGSVLSDQTVSKRRDHGNSGNTPSSKPIPTGESFVPGNENAKTYRSTNRDELETVVCSLSSRVKRKRKASMVKDPIPQYVRRQKSQIA